MIIGSLVVLISIIGYVDAATLISQMVHSMMSSFVGSTPGSFPITTSSMLHSMGYPSKSTVVLFMQYSFVGLAIAGIGMMVHGAVAKNFKKQFTVELDTDEPYEIKKSYTNFQPMDEKLQANSKAISRLQERLANGEIRTDEFERIKKFLE